MGEGLRPDMISLGAPMTMGTQSISETHPSSDIMERQSTTASATPSHSDDRHPTPPDDGPWMSGVTLSGDNENNFGETSREVGVPASYGMKRSVSDSADEITALGPRVSVSKGKRDFAALERHYSNLSQNSPTLERTSTRRSMVSGFAKPERVLTTASSAGVPDVEKGKTEDDDFDLAAVLRSGRQQSDASGIKHKSVGVVWEDLEVIGAGGMKINIRNFSNAVMEQFMMPVISLLGLVGYKPFAPKPKTILHKASGVLKPGEMCLVIGRPGAGCSTFLKAIANQRDGFMKVNGDVQYAGVGWKEMAKVYSG